MVINVNIVKETLNGVLNIENYDYFNYFLDFVKNLKG